MRLQSSVALAALLPFLSSVLASDVLDLTASTFSKEVMQEDLALVEFFAPWCGHCKNLAPHYEEAATELKSSKGIKLAKVDCTEEAALCADYGVQGYPTLKVFRNGVPSDYAGPRKADGIISYMVKQSLPSVTDVTPEAHQEFTKADKVVVIAYGDASHPVPAAFNEYAESARDSFLFGRYSGTPNTLPEGVSIPSLPAIVLYKSFDEGSAVFPSSLSSASIADLADFVKSNSIPLMDEISPENFATYAEQGLPLAYLFVDPAATSSREALVKELSPLAKELKSDINFVWIDGVKFADHGKSLSLPEGFPGFVIQDLAEQTKYPLVGQKVNPENIGKFVRGVLSGDIGPTIKSAPIPTEQGPVYKLVSDDWDNLFKDTSKDVFAEFFAPWCGHCQRLAPIWEELGEKYADSKNIVIAQMDATENDIPPQAPFKVQGFPTLKFRPAGSSEFIDYGGDRSLESLIEFIEDNRSSSAGAAGNSTGDVAEEENVIEHDEL